jgi:hypothetical protein
MKNEPPQKNNKWLAVLSLPAQMGGIVFLFSYAGNWLDKNHPNSQVYYVKIMVMLGVFCALYNAIRQVNQINKKE